MVEKLERLVYRSQPVLPLAHKRVIADIFAASVRRNAADRLTGALVVTPDRFIQVLEGPAPGIADLQRRLRADPRHCNLEVIAHLPITDRLFAGWPMARADLAGAPSFIDQMVSQTGTGVQVSGLVLGLVMESSRQMI